MVGVIQDHHLLGGVEVGVEVSAGAVVTVDPDLLSEEAVAMLCVRDQEALTTAGAQSRGRALHLLKGGSEACHLTAAGARPQKGMKELNAMDQTTVGVLGGRTAAVL